MPSTDVASPDEERSSGQPFVIALTHFAILDATRYYGRSVRSGTLDDFEIVKVIDKGSFGKVFLVSNRKMGKMYAMKRINKELLLQKKQVQNIKNEKDILFQAEHPFVNSMDFVF